LLLDKAGNIYGTTISGSNGGVAFKLSPSGSGWQETVLHSFGIHSPSSGLIMDGFGSLYGETAGGGAFDDGTVFVLKPTSSGYQYHIVYSFAAANDGIQPANGQIFDSKGDLFGTTTGGGGLTGAGTVFELQRGTNGQWTESVIHSFTTSADGVTPQAPVVIDSAGNLYGTTSSGGALSCGQGLGCGTVYELTPSGGSWTLTTLHNFTDNPDGHAPLAGLTLDSDGNLYGTTSNGGTSGTGVVFELTASSGGFVESVVYSFSGGSDGGFPDTPVLIGSGGNIFGTANFGGSANDGVVFAIKP